LSPLNLTLELMDRSDEKEKEKKKKKNGGDKNGGDKNGGDKSEIDLRELFSLVNDMILESMASFYKQPTENK